jgi:hypothetical protein
MIKANNTSKICFKACTTEQVNNGQCGCLIKTHVLFNETVKQNKSMDENNLKPSAVLTEKQKFVIDYLKSIYNSDYELNGAWVSPTLVGKIYGIKFLNKLNCHSSTGSPILKKLTELGFVDRNENGWYRFLKNYS